MNTFKLQHSYHF